MTVSSITPPIEPLRMLFAIQQNELASSTKRMGIPRIKKRAIVARQPPATGSHPARLWTSTHPTARLIARKRNATQRDRVLSDRNDRAADTIRLPIAG